MATFQSAVQNTLLWEGGYSNDPNDSGGETYEGISRRNWPAWAGWASIDSAKSQPNFPHSLNSNSVLQGNVVDFYRQNYWKYDDILSQAVANKIFDLAVNVGQVHAHKIAQHTVNTLSPGTHLQEDGILGPASIAAINVLDGAMLVALRQSAVQYHQSIVASNPQDAEYLAGWIRRDES